PGVTLLVDACELTELGTVGEGKHLRFRVRQRGHDAGSAIAFGFGAQLDRFRRLGRYDIAFRLQENRWNGTVAPQLVVRRIVDELLADVEGYKPDADRELLTRAFDFAARAHDGQLRRSGQEFIYHPWGAAKILAGLRLDEATLAAALLHDTVEDTGIGIDDIRSEFGDEIAKLVEGVTKLTRVQFQSREHAEAENYRKLVLAMAEDLRVILIKLADRLHNLRTIEYMGKQTQVRKAKETLEVYAPLAHRLGIHALKWELEDLAFQTLHPRKYEEIKQMVAERRADREEHVREASMVLQ